MKALMAVFVAVALVLVGAGCTNSSGGDTRSSSQKQYACPMGCVTTDTPGKCPKCGMEMKRK